MNLNDEEEDLFFNQRCLELAKLLRSEQTEDFLHLYDSLPSEWNGSRLETAKEYIRQLQELDEHEFELTYQRVFRSREEEQNYQIISMSNLSRQSADEQINNRISSVSISQQNERTTTCDEKHDLSPKYSSSIKKNNDESNPKSRRLQSITNNNTHDMIQNNCRTRTPVDSFVQLNLKPSIDITLEDYKKAKVPNSISKSNIINNRPSTSQSIGSIESKEQSNIIKKHKTSMKNKSHEEACFGYFSNNNDDESQHSRSSSSSSPTNLFPTTNDLLINQILPQSNLSEHSKLIPNNDFDSHGSSIATKSSSDNSGSARTGSGSDSDQSGKNIFLSLSKSSLLSKNKLLNNNDDTPTMVLNQTSDHRTNQYDYNSSLPKQDSYELVQLNTNDEHHVFGSQVSRFKLSAIDDPNALTNSNNDILSYTPQRSQTNNLSSSSHQNRNPERHEQYNTNHSSSSRKSTRSTKKRKQLQQQEIIRTELIPGHRGDRDVDELVMFIDGNSSSKQRQQNSAPLRPTDTNKFKTTSSLPDTNSNNNSTSRRKSRKPIQILHESINNNENKTSQIDDDIHSIGFIDEDDETTHSINNNPLPNDDESHSNIHSPTNGETSLPEWLESNHSTSLLNNSNSEILSEPFVTVTHRRRLIKERRQDNNPSSSALKTSSNINDKRRFQPPPSSSSTQNGILRPTLRNSLSNIKPFVSTTTKEDNTNIISPPLQPTSQTSIPPPPSILPEQSSPRLSSHSSSSSLSSSLKRQSKAPPVVFLNKSIDIELNDVSFGFDVENPSIDKPLTPPSIPIEKEIETETNTLSSTQSNDQTTNSKSPSSSYRRSYQQQRNNRGPLFYSGSDIRPHHHRNYPSQPPVSQSPYIDPLLLFQYNQQRYSQQVAYMNLLRAQYLSSQSQYVLIPTSTTNYSSTTQDEKPVDDESIQPSEPLLVYTTIPTQTGPVYLHSNKKSFNDQEMYPSHYFYPTHTAYFQPISSPSLLIDTKSQQDNTDDEEEEDDDNDYDKSTKSYHQTRQSSSSHIMSNALQLVYSQEKRNAQTDRFNLDQLTAYLAMKWTDTIDHFEQGDDGILLTGD